MNLNQFVQKNTGKTVDYDGLFPGQCVDLYRLYVRDVLGFPQSPQVPSARLIWNTYLDEYFDRTPNTLFAIPQKGDIVIWRAFPGNPHGHVGICLSGKFWSFTSFDSNWSTPLKAKVEHHSYFNVMGWLRPKKTKHVIDRVNEALRERGDDPTRSVGTLNLSRWWQKRVAFDPQKFTNDEAGYRALVGAIEWHQVNKKYPHDV